MFNWIRGFLSAKNDLSSKRLVMILSYVAAIVYAGACIFFGFPLENNVLTLLLSALGGSTGGYVFSYRTEAGSIVPSTPVLPATKKDGE